MGDFCAAKYGKSWKRCRITEIGVNMWAVVECVDNLRVQRVPLSKLEKLNDNFRRMGKLAMNCRLAGLDSANLFAFNEKVIEKFKEIIKDKELVVEIVLHSEEINEVNLLTNDGQDILVFMNKLAKEIQK